MKKTKRVALYSPYLDVLGGGERHILSLLQVFDEAGYATDLFWSDVQIVREIKKRFSYDFAHLSVRENFLLHNSFVQKYMQTRQYDALFYVTDGSYFFSAAGRNFVFCMYPKRELYDLSFTSRLKLHNYSFLANSEFTARFIREWIGKQVEVIYPYVDEAFFSHSPKKEKIILSVGRFFGHLHSKRQDVIIKAYQRLREKEEAFGSYKLYLVGALRDEDKKYLENLKKVVKDDKDIVFVINPTFNQLVNYYARASVYWHAAGYDVDEGRLPHLVEHLGLTPMEAMASRCVTFCHNSGGPKEYVKDGETGFLYDDAAELVEKTAFIVHDSKYMKRIVDQAEYAIKLKFSYDVFKKKVKKYFEL